MPCRVTSRLFGPFVRSFRRKQEQSLRVSRDRINGDMRNFLIAIDEFKLKSDVSQLSSNCEQLASLKSTLDATDRCAPRYSRNAVS
jgi:hypothetical protein